MFAFSPILICVSFSSTIIAKQQHGQEQQQPKGSATRKQVQGQALICGEGAVPQARTTRAKNCGSCWRHWKGILQSCEEVDRLLQVLEHPILIAFLIVKLSETPMYKLIHLVNTTSIPSQTCVSLRTCRVASTQARTHAHTTTTTTTAQQFPPKMPFSLSPRV